jgi:hypothetical protein
LIGSSIQTPLLGAPLTSSIIVSGDIAYAAK